MRYFIAVILCFLAAISSSAIQQLDIVRSTNLNMQQFKNPSTTTDSLQRMTDGSFMFWVSLIPWAIAIGIIFFMFRNKVEVK